MKVLVLGASVKLNRSSNNAVRELHRHHHEVIALGFREGKIGQIKILTGQPLIDDVDTISLYLGAKNQKPFYDYILSLHPQRIIFNPGTWNPELMELVRNRNIEAIEDCMLVMLQTGKF